MNFKNGVVYMNTLFDTASETFNPSWEQFSFVNIAFIIIIAVLFVIMAWRVRADLQDGELDHTPKDGLIITCRIIAIVLGVLIGCYNFWSALGVPSSGGQESNPLIVGYTIAGVLAFWVVSIAATLVDKILNSMRKQRDTEVFVKEKKKVARDATLDVE